MVEVPAAVVVQQIEVAIPVGDQCGGEGDDDLGRDSAAPHDGVDQRSADAPVAVGERVDGLELGMCDRRLDEGWHVVAVGERDQVPRVTLHHVRRRWDKECNAG